MRKSFQEGYDIQIVGQTQLNLMYKRLKIFTQNNLFLFLSNDS